MMRTKLTSTQKLMIAIVSFTQILFVCGICAITASISDTEQNIPTTSIEQDYSNTTQQGEVRAAQQIPFLQLDQSPTTTENSSYSITGTVTDEVDHLSINDQNIRPISKNDNRIIDFTVTDLLPGDNEIVIKTFDEHDQLLSEQSLHIKYSLPNVKLLDVIDGDTIKVQINNQEELVRLIGIDAPEKNECLYERAADFLKAALNGKTVRLEYDESQGEKDKYDRILAYVWTEDGNVNEKLIKQGFAKEYTYAKKYRYQADFQNAQQEAQQAKLEIWGEECACTHGEEISRSCIGCHQARITKHNWDCSKFTTDVEDYKCTDGCTPSPPPAPTAPSSSSHSSGITHQNAPTPAPPPYQCNCSKSCKRMSSCAEAYYQLNTCGCTARDGDHDGIPCEKICH